MSSFTDSFYLKSFVVSEVVGGCLRCTLSFGDEQSAEYRQVWGQTRSGYKPAPFTGVSVWACAAQVPCLKEQGVASLELEL